MHYNKLFFFFFTALIKSVVTFFFYPKFFKYFYLFFYVLNVFFFQLIVNVITMFFFFFTLASIFYKKAYIKYFNVKSESIISFLHFNIFFGKILSVKWFVFFFFEYKKFRIFIKKFYVLHTWILGSLMVFQHYKLSPIDSRLILKYIVSFKHIILFFKFVLFYFSQFPRILFRFVSRVLLGYSDWEFLVTVFIYTYLFLRMKKHKSLISYLFTMFINLILRLGKILFAFLSFLYFHLLFLFKALSSSTLYLSYLYVNFFGFLRNFYILEYLYFFFFFFFAISFFKITLSSIEILIFLIFILVTYTIVKNLYFFFENAVYTYNLALLEKYSIFFKYILDNIKSFIILLNSKLSLINKFLFTFNLYRKILAFMRKVNSTFKLYYKIFFF